MTARESTILALLGLGIWLSGAAMFRFGGALMFENGPAILAASGAGVALSVCLLLKATMDWRKIGLGLSVPVAVVMTLPGLFGDVAYILAFTRITGLKAETAGPYAGVVIFGTAVLYLYALVRARQSAPF
jgi:hypothetical protein